MQIIGESYGKDSVQNAWREFTIGSGEQFLGDDPNAELFFAWLFHRWSPESAAAHKIDDESCYGVPPTRAYLARNASDLDPLQRRYLEACLAACFSFYEILDCKPHIGFRARDVLAGGEVEAMSGLPPRRSARCWRAPMGCNFFAAVGSRWIARNSRSCSTGSAASNRPQPRAASYSAKPCA